MKVALVCCGRLENRYAVEFVEYYKQLGFDHIYIADNNRGDEEHFEDVLQPYVDENFVTIHNFRNEKAWIHYTYYMPMYYKLSDDYDWIAFYDFDEYLTLVEDNNIKDYLSRDCFKNYNQILINWKTYTDNDLIYDDGRPCLERFTTPMELNKKAEPNDWCITNMCIKTIIRTGLKNIEYETNHCFKNDLLKTTTCNNCGNTITNITYFQPINYTLAYIKHFPTKTIEEFVKFKQIRGTGILQEEDIERTSLNRFFRYNNITKSKLQYLKDHNINYNIANIALVCCGRLENRYAVEFVEHYKQLGFDHIYIADNNHDWEEHFEDVLQPYIDDDFVTICDYRNVIGIQWFIYLKMYNDLNKLYDWIFFCDFDEYLTLVEDNNIKDYLSRDCFKDYNQILINWKIYTDNNLVYDDGRPCLERFTRESTNKKLINGWNENHIIKSIVRCGINDINQNNLHFFYNDLLNKTTCNNEGIKCEPKSEIDISYTLAYIKHFTTKTIDEWINNKCIRGVGDRSIENFAKDYDLNRFFKYNDITPEKIEYLKANNIKYDYID